MFRHGHSQSPGAAAAPQQVRAAAWDLRVLRAMPFAAVCTLAAVAGHMLASGGTVPLWAPSAGFAVVCAAAVLLGGRERSLAAIAGGLVTGQVAMHCLFHGAQGMAHSLGAMAGTEMGPPAVGGRPGSVGAAVGGLLCGAHHHGAGAPVLPSGVTAQQLWVRTGFGPSAYAPSSGLRWWHTPVLGLTPVMLVGHLAAALAVGWWLRRGEAALWRLVRLAGKAAQTQAAPVRIALAVAGALLSGLLSGTPTARPLREYERGRGDRRLPTPATLRHALVRRGPPVAACAG
jgi:hypothetical protein